MKGRIRLKAVICSTFVAIVTTWVVPAPVSATPPPWAPAHGWRRQHDPYYVGYHGKHWRDDFGVLSGSCHRAAIGAAVGGAVGGAVGSTIGKGDTRTVAIVVGVVLGTVIGHEVGREMDDRDRACFGHSLELATTGHTVRWTDPDMGVSYALTPARVVESKGQLCRDYALVTAYQGAQQAKSGRACRSDDGVWRSIGLGAQRSSADPH
jgi:surface antigen